MAEMRVFRCSGCEHLWEEPYGTGRPAECPACQGQNIERVDRDGMQGRAGEGRGRRGNRGGGAGRGRGAGQGRGAGRGRKAGRATNEGPDAEKTSIPEEESGE